MFNPIRDKKPSQLDSDSGLSRAGGAASKGSAPVMQNSIGSGLARMQSMLMSSKDGLDSQDVTKLAGGSAGKQRQFGTLASTGKAPAPKKGKIFRVPK